MSSGPGTTFTWVNRISGLHLPSRALRADRPRSRTGENARDPFHLASQRAQMGDEAEQTEETTPREMNADPWQDHIRLSEFEPRFICTACGGRGAEIRPVLRWDKTGRHWCAYAGLSSQMSCPHSHRKSRTIKFRRTSKNVSVKRK
jgi:hypothetical protein